MAEHASELAGLPAADRVARGLEDLARGELTVHALLLAVASTRLTDLGIPLPRLDSLPRDPELALYELLCSRSEDPYSAYRAALDELDSFLSSLEARRGASARRNAT